MVVHKIVVHKLVYHNIFGVYLGSKSNISRIKTALQEKEMIDYDKDGVYLEDPVFKTWSFFYEKTCLFPFFSVSLSRH